MDEGRLALDEVKFTLRFLTPDHAVKTDDAEAFTLRLPAGMPEPSGVHHVTGTGDLSGAEFLDGRVRTARPLRQWELVVLSS